MIGGDEQIIMRTTILYTSYARHYVPLICKNQQNSDKEP